ncbi:MULTISPECIES: hypothetical protein [unclassified Jeotgalibaca]|uniref:hypothetical protein n=1 Tax=unclassified Jeotgalibaca TaxID=2621505 RepID=UPI003FD2455C
MTEKKPIITRKTYQSAKDELDKEVGAGKRSFEKEQGRKLDTFYNWAIIIVAIAIVLVFVLAFVI